MTNRTDATGADVNPFFLDIQKAHTQNIIGFTDDEQSIDLYVSRITQYSQKISKNPEILDEYRIPIDSSIKSVVDVPKIYNELDWEKKYYIWRANPWLAAWDLIGDVALNRTTAAGAPTFTKFTKQQRQFLRDFCDPRFNFMATRRCRGGSKTFDIAVAMCIMEFLVPKLRITINSGSEKQSQNLYKYFSTFVNYSTLGRIVDGEVLKKETNFVHGGWVQALTASPKQSKGVRPDIIVFDEICEIIEQLIDDALGGTWTAMDLKIIFAGTPEKMAHRFYRIQRHPKTVTKPGAYNDGRVMSEDGYYIYHSTAYDCPWIPEKNIIWAKDHIDKNTFRIQFMGEFGSASGTVFDHDDIEFSKVYKYDIDNILNTLIDKSLGVDWGYAHKTGVIVCGIDVKDVMHVVYSKGSARMRIKAWTDDIIPSVAAKYDPSTVGGDAAGGGYNAQLEDSLEPLNLDVNKMAFQKYKDKMIGALRSRFEHQTIKIYVDRTENNILLEQLFAYEWKKTLVGEVSDKPAKGNDDYIDALLIAAYPLRMGQFEPDDEDEDDDTESGDIFGMNDDNTDFYRAL